MINLEPRNSEFNFQYGIALVLSKNYLEAIPILKNAIDLKSDFSDAHVILGDTFQAVKKDHEAIGIFDPSDDFIIMQEYAYMGSKTKVEKLLEIIKPAVISGNFKNNTLSQGTLLGLIGEAYLKINELDSALKYSSWESSLLIV